MAGNTSAVTGCTHAELHKNSRASIREKYDIIARGKKNVMRTWRVISIIAENKLHAHHKTHLHTMKVYNTHDRSFAN